MTPYQLAKESESSQQMALFCYCAKAQKIGFARANDKSYWDNNIVIHEESHKAFAVPELAFFHHIPNGGSRGDSARSAAIAGGRLKAEGVKAGVLDCFWPLVRGHYHGLYIEMKKPSLKTANVLNGVSKEQREFGSYVIEQGYSAIVCYDWLEAANVLESYYKMEK